MSFLFTNKHSKCFYCVAAMIKYCSGAGAVSKTIESLHLNREGKEGKEGWRKTRRRRAMIDLDLL